jgi:CRP/FNR family transcriptional regulator, cyclic AMP receptor protein
MISTERLRRHPHFASVSDENLKKVAMLCKLVEFHEGDVILAEGEDADGLLILEEGEVDIVYLLGDQSTSVVDTIVSGELLGWSALLEPYKLTATGIAKNSGCLIEVQAAGLRELCEADHELGSLMMTQVARALRGRLGATRVQLAVAN